jgi:hypothetical protein
MFGRVLFQQSRNSAMKTLSKTNEEARCRVIHRADVKVGKTKSWSKP